MAMKEIVMATSESYWAYARECENWAKKVAEETDRMVFFEMANAWKELAIRETLRAGIGNKLPNVETAINVLPPWAETSLTVKTSRRNWRYAG
jgi:hypothetical protein